MNETVTIETITPAVAAKFLTHNIGNRVVSSERVKIWARAMTDGKWKLGTTAFGFDRDGRLIQGQHRLLAVLETGVTIRGVVLRGLSVDTFAIEDTGKPRSAGDVLGSAGITNRNAIASAARVVIGYESNTLHDTYRLQAIATHDRILDEVELHAADYEFWSQASNQHGIRSKCPGINPSGAAAFGILASREYGRDMPKFFFDTVVAGTGLDQGAPQLALRSWMANARRMNRHHHLAAWIRAFNYDVQGQSLKMVKSWITGQPFPSFVGR